MAYNIEFQFPGTLVTVPLAAETIVASTSSRFTSVCPKCPTATKISQVSVCSEHDDHGPFTRDELAKARPVGRGKNTVLVPFTREETVVGTPVPVEQSGKAPLHAHPAEQIAQAGMRPGTKQYWLQLQKGQTNNAGYGAMLAAAKNPDVVWMTHLRIGQSVALYRLEVDPGGHLTLVELVHPENVKAAPVVDFDETVADQQAATILGLVDVEDFDPDVYADRGLTEIDALAARKIEAGEMTVVEPEPDEGRPAELVDDLTAMLEASLATRRSAHPVDGQPANQAQAV